MKKAWFTAISTALFLFACSPSSTDPSGPAEETDARQATQSTATATSETSEQADADEMSPATEDAMANAEVTTDFEQYEELSYQEYFDPAAHTAHLLTDNPGTRIFIFQDGAQQAYKTIFVKQENRLKIIDLQNDKLLMNEVLR